MKTMNLNDLNNQEIRACVEEMIQNPESKKNLMTFLVAEELRLAQEHEDLQIDRPNICQMLDELQRTTPPTQMRQITQRELVKIHRKRFPAKRSFCR